MGVYAGESTKPVPAPMVKQIAGRAGRYARGHPTGYVTCLNERDLPALHEAIAAGSVDLDQACLLPRWVFLCAAWI